MNTVGLPGHLSNQNKDSDTSLNVNDTDQTSLSAAFSGFVVKYSQSGKTAEYLCSLARGVVFFFFLSLRENNPYDVIRLVTANASNIEHKDRITSYLWKV